MAFYSLNVPVCEGARKKSRKGCTCISLTVLACPEAALGFMRAEQAAAADQIRGGESSPKEMKAELGAECVCVCVCVLCTIERLRMR